MTLTRLASLTLLLVATATPCLADSLASSASSAGSASLGSASNSSAGSSNSSERKPTTAQGDYKVIEVAGVAERPGMLRLHLQATLKPGGEGILWLVLPQQVLAQRPIVPGDIVSARPRPYGVEFARAGVTSGREAFFLVLADDWHRELEPRVLRL